MKKRILFQGDSITDCGRNREDSAAIGQGYAFLVKSQLGCENPDAYEFFNRGISGNRSVDVYARIKKDIINLQPDYMSLLMGVNDVWHEESQKNGVDAAKFEKIYDMLIEEVLQACPNVKIMIMEPFVLKGYNTEAIESNPGRWDAFRTGVPQRAAAAKRIAEKYGLPYSPLQAQFDESCKKAPVEHWLYDGVHPTPMGHWIIKEEWLKAFRNL